MNKLLSANFARLVKNKVFQGGMILMTCFAVYTCVNQYVEIGRKIALDDIAFIYTIFICILSAVFSSLFLGTEYSEGTLRNKVVVGHTRVKIYLSGLLTCIAAAIFMCLAYIATVTVVGTFLFGFYKEPVKILLYILCSFCMAASFTSLIVMVAFLYQNKAGVSVINILGTFALLIAAASVDMKLQEPEFYQDQPYYDAVKEEIVTDMTIPNPNYLEGKTRAVYEFINDFQPVGQAYQLALLATDRLWLFALYDIIVMILTGGIGLWVFRRKDLR